MERSELEMIMRLAVLSVRLCTR